MEFSDPFGLAAVFCDGPMRLSALSIFAVVGVPSDVCMLRAAEGKLETGGGALFLDLKRNDMVNDCVC